MAKEAIIFLSLYFLAVKGAVVRYEDEVLTRVPRCDTCQQTQGPPPPHPPRYYHAHHWSGFARDANNEGVFTGAAAAAQGGEQTGQVFSLAASEAESGSGYGGQAQIGAGTAGSQKLGAGSQSGSKNYKEHSDDQHSAQNFDDNTQQVQSNGINSASQGLSQSSADSGAGYGHGQFGKYSSGGRDGASGHSDSQEQVKVSDNFGRHEQQSQSQGGYGSGAQAGAASGNAGGNGGVGTGIEYGLSNDNQQQIQSNGFNSASQRQAQGNGGSGYGHGHFGGYGGKSDQSETQKQQKFGESFGQEQQSLSHGGYGFGAQAGANAGTSGRGDIGTGLEYGASDNNQQQVQSNGFNSASQRQVQDDANSGTGYGGGHFGKYSSGSHPVDIGQSQQKDFGRGFGRHEQRGQSQGGYGSGGQAGAGAGSAGSGGVGTGLDYRGQESAQSTLGGALNLASQGLQVTQPPGCSTCGRSSYALSNAKSYSGSAVALSIGG